MAARIIDGPDKEWLSEEEAMDWLCVGEVVFGKLLEKHAWFKARRMSTRSSKYYWLDLVCISRILQLGTDSEEK